MVTTVQIYTC